MDDGQNEDRGGAEEIPDQARRQQAAHRALGDEPLIHPHDPDEEAGENDVPRLHTRWTVPKPSKRTMMEHQVTHVPFAPWCETCVRMRGLDHPHRRGDDSSQNEVMHKVHFDYGFFRVQPSAPLVPFLIGVCGRTSMRFGAVIFDRRGRNPVSAKLIKKGLHDVGAHGAVTLRSDGENALADLPHAVASEKL